MKPDFSFGSDLYSCAQSVQAADQGRFAAATCAPLEGRAKLFALYAFNIEVSRAPWASAEPMMGQMRLQWWADSLKQIKVAGPHHILSPLSDWVGPWEIGLMLEMIEARRLDVLRAPFERNADLWDYLARTSGHLMRLSASALGDQDGRAAGLFGQACGLAAYLRALPELEARGRLPLADGRPEALADLAREGLAVLASARALRKGLMPSALPAFYVAPGIGTVLRRALRDPASIRKGTLYLSRTRTASLRLWQVLMRRY